MENITKSWQNEELADVNTVIVSVAAMPYGFWQRSLLNKASEDKQPWSLVNQVSSQTLQRSLLSFLALKEM